MTDLLTPAELAEMLGMSEATLQLEYTKAGA